MLESKIDCCGSNFRNERISIIGIVTFAYPLLIILIMTKPLVIISKLIGQNLYLQHNKIEKATLKVIAKATLLPRLKCNLSAFIYKFAPRTSGFVFKYFNVSFISICWLLISIFAIISYYELKH